ncbi:mechanosensitive ion channel family protein [Jannaschia ovalis]|uniref:Small-conductance mechanosensitive channel n=1 Tax=Jannaschia ovalis TaxID=3038773 RepID=A0ABY8LDJ4_9RHOB|nr:mechanosensitive ion channel family protein [Jannaschia sp. GRR-S6-38]WGH78140.1 mechanosensitive ion channel family protein [Jannaschia sp. GRR-S6-38]
MEQDTDPQGATGFDQVTADTSLIFAKLDSWLEGFFRLLPNLAVALVVALLFVAAGATIGWAVSRTAASRGRNSLGSVLGSILRWLVAIAGLLIAFTIVVPSLRLGDLVAGLGIGSVAIGFAFKDILQNLFAGLLILFRQPFRTGDQIVTGNGYEGTVEEIEMRATLIRTYDGRRVVIPNAQVYTDAITVNTAFETRRSEYDFGIHYDADTGQAIDVAVQAARGVDGVLADPAPEALSTNLGDFAKSVRLRWWTASTQAEVVHTRSAVMLAVERAFADAGIAIPFPTQTLHLGGSLETEAPARRQEAAE